MDDDELATDLERILAAPDDSVACAHLAAGFPIYSVERDTPPGQVVKHFPDGRREMVWFDLRGEHKVQIAA